MHRCNFTITQNLLPLVPFALEKPHVFIGRDPRVFPWDAPDRCRSSQPPFLSPNDLCPLSSAPAPPASSQLLNHPGSASIRAIALPVLPQRKPCPLALSPGSASSSDSAQCHLLRGAPTSQLKQLPWLCFLHHRWTNVLTSLLPISPTSLEPEVGPRVLFKQLCLHVTLTGEFCLR